MNFMINFQFVITFKVLFSSDTHVSDETSHFSVEHFDKFYLSYYVFVVGEPALPGSDCQHRK